MSYESGLGCLWCPILRGDIPKPSVFVCVCVRRANRISGAKARAAAVSLYPSVLLWLFCLRRQWVDACGLALPHTHAISTVISWMLYCTLYVVIHNIKLIILTRVMSFSLTVLLFSWFSKTLADTHTQHVMIACTVVLVSCCFYSSR